MKKYLLLGITFFLLTHPLLAQEESNAKGIFLLSHIQLAYTVWGPTITSLLGERMDWEQQAAIYLLSASSSFFVPLLLTKGHLVSYAQWCLSYYGAYRGYLVGYTLADLLINWNNSAKVEKGCLTKALVGSWIGDYLGFKIAKKNRYSHSTTEMLGMAGDWGLIYGLGLGALVIPWSPGGEVWKRKLIQTFSLSGLGLGLLYWDKLGSRDYTVGDALSFRVQSLLDLLTVGTIYSYLSNYVLQPKDELTQKIYLFFCMAGQAGGLYLDYQFHQTKELSFSQGLITVGGAVAGGLFGLAINLLFKVAEPPLWLTFLTAGGWAGYFTSFAMIGQEERIGDSKRRLRLLPENVGLVMLGAKLNQSIKLPLLNYSF